jgi:hypothetical protein
MMDLDKEKVAVVANFDNLMEAEMAKNRLQEGGIECFISDVNTALLGTFYLEKLSGIRLFVLEKDLEQAGLILGEQPTFPNED